MRPVCRNDTPYVSATNRTSEEKALSLMDRLIDGEVNKFRRPNKRVLPDGSEEPPPKQNAVAPDHDAPESSENHSPVPQREYDPLVDEPFYFDEQAVFDEVDRALGRA